MHIFAYKNSNCYRMLNLQCYLTFWKFEFYREFFHLVIRFSIYLHTFRFFSKFNEIRHTKIDELESISQLWNSVTFPTSRKRNIYFNSITFHFSLKKNSHSIVFQMNGCNLAFKRKIILCMAVRITLCYTRCRSKMSMRKKAVYTETFVYKT